MELTETLVSVVHVLASVALVGLILLQHGKGADAGAAFGSGASQTVFGSQGSGSFLTKLTTWITVVFFVTSFSLAVFAKQKAEKLAGHEGLVPELQSVPAESINNPAGASEDEKLPAKTEAPKSGAPELE